MKRSYPAEIAAEVAASILLGPVTAPAIRNRVGIDPKHCDVVTKYITEFRQSGCVYVTGFDEYGYELYAWQPRLFEHQDALRTSDVPVRRRGGAGRPPRLLNIGGRLMTVAQLAAMERVGIATMRKRLQRGYQPVLKSSQVG